MVLQEFLNPEPTNIEATAWLAEPTKADIDENPKCLTDKFIMLNSYKKYIQLVENSIKSLQWISVICKNAKTLEAGEGIEPSHSGFADRRLTTWQTRHKKK